MPLGRLDRPTMDRQVHPVALGVGDPALPDRDRRVIHRLGLCDFLDFPHILYLKAEVVDAPRASRVRK